MKWISIFYSVCIAILLYGLFAIACEKTQAAPRVLSAVACADTAGIYTPQVLSSFNAGISPGTVLLSADFIRVCNVVYVSGHFAGTAAVTDTNTFASIQLSLPIPSNLSAPPVNHGGLCLFSQSLAPQPIGGSVGLALVADHGLTIKFNPKKLKPVSVVYYFTYTIQ